jgi:modification methylase
MSNDALKIDYKTGSAVRDARGLDTFTPAALLRAVEAEPQKGIPAIARDSAQSAALEEACSRVPSSHDLVIGDSRDLSFIPDESVHLVVTSPPYWTLKEYVPSDGQLGYVSDYEEFNDQLTAVWAHCLRVLVPGGRLVINVGDICLPRRTFGRHVVFPLHATIQERCRALGFDNLAPIVWYKIGNAKFEAGGGGFLGKPYEPNAVMKNDIEWVLFQRKPGGYRSPSSAARTLSVIPEARHREWFQQVWTMTGASTRDHPAPYPLAFAERLVRMFSFVGDTVLDPFSGTGTTSAACLKWGRDSIGVEVEPQYHEQAVRRVSKLAEKGSQLDLIPATEGA